jgi:hypothetical protein
MECVCDVNYVTLSCYVVRSDSTASAADIGVRNCGPTSPSRLSPRKLQQNTHQVEWLWAETREGAGSKHVAAVGSAPLFS